jgi:diguanylate cyclase (GGDEF)-like protein/PAS domain S-box-containing protein
VAADFEARALALACIAVTYCKMLAPLPNLPMRPAPPVSGADPGADQPRDVGGPHDAADRYRAFVDALSDMVSLAEPDGRLVYVNPAYARYFDKRPTDMIGKSLYDWVQPEDRVSVAQLLTQVMATGASQTGENRMVAADGSERWVAWTNDVQIDPGHQQLLRSVGRDITRQKQTEMALRASQAFLERTGKVAGVGGWELDLLRGTLTWSDETRRIHEVDDNYQPSLETAIEFYAPAARPVIEAAVQQAIAQGKAWDIELPLATARGREIWVRAVGEAQFENGQAVRLLGAFQDITERRRLEQKASDSERFSRLVADNVPIRIAYLDRDRRYRFVNAAVLRRFRLERDEVVGRTRAELLPGADDSPLAARAEAALAGQTQQFEFEELVDGQPHRFENRLVPDLAETGEVRGFFLTGVDITDRHAAEQAVARQTATLRSVTEAIPATVAVVAPDGRYRFVNSAFERWCHMPRQQIIGRTAAEVVGAWEYARRRPWIERALSGEAVNFTLDYPSDKGELHRALSYVPLRLAGGELDGFVAVTQDISEQKREEGRLLQLAQRDPLTGLLNRAGFEHRLDAMARAGFASEPQDSNGLALLYIDLDNFKPVNDRHGHPAGDEVLEQFARRLGALVRGSDLVARLGGDEFAVALAGLRDVAAAQAIADKVLVAAHTPFALGRASVQVGASVGVAFAADMSASWRELLAQADAHLLAAKAAGKGRQVGEAA